MAWWMRRKVPAWVEPAEPEYSEEYLRETYPEAARIWDVVEGMPLNYGIEMVNDVLKVKEELDNAQAE